MSHTENFERHMLRKEYVDAATMVRKHAALLVRGAEGAKHFESAIKSDDAALVTAFLDNGADPFGDARNTSFIHLASECYPRALSAMLDHKSMDKARLRHFLQKHIHLSPLDRSLDEHAIHVKRNGTGPRDELAHQCIGLLLDAGIDPDSTYSPLPGETKVSALQAACSSDPARAALPLNLFTKMVQLSRNLEQRDSGGKTLLMLAVSFLSPNEARVLLTHGADLYARDDNGETVLDHHHAGKTLGDASYNELRKLRREWRRDIRSIVKNGNHDDTLHKTVNAPPIIGYLAANVAGPLFDIAYWKRHASPEAGIAFARQVYETLPPHLQHLTKRIDLSPLQREAPLPHEDSVVVQYARGNAPNARLPD